ncbi:purine-cytosine permease family protein [Terrilactibacillus tamarindi]|uniref:purine-cytosine permease family protein n=1 Tax=Terrilactibacillus tamarindi TaxID=2599694 RepID=UPI002E34B18B|nr:cytosine permease [Terrilactibacillus tamarindi]
MNQIANQEVNQPANQTVSSDDYSLDRVPKSERKSMFSILLVRIGALTSISQFMLGATLGYGMTLWQAFVATFLGSVILQVVSVLLGIAGAKEGMSTSLLSRWTGFGRIGSSIMGLIFAISLTGWFGVQNAVFAQGIDSVFGNRLGFTLAAIITGIFTTLLVYFGYKMLDWTARITVPLFLIVMGYGVFQVLKDYNFAHLATMNPPGPALGLGAAITMVAGGFIVGCVTTPDFTRFAKSSKDVIWITVIGTFLGELGVNLIAVLMAHAVGSAEIMAIVLKLTGLIGGIIVAFATLKINDLNLYSSSLGITTFFSSVFNVQLNRGMLTLVLGVIGTLLTIAGILDNFTGFLTILGIAVPPIAGIMTVDYYILKTNEEELTTSRKVGVLPSKLETVNWIGMIAWIGGFLVGYFITFGIQALTSIIAGSIIYYILMILFKRK